MKNSDIKTAEALSFLWRWSPIVTLPFVLLVGAWISTTYERYSTFGLRHESAPFQAKLRTIGNSEYSRFLSKTAITLRPGGSTNEFRTIDLFLNESDEAKLGERLPQSGREYVPGHLLYPGGKSYPVQLKYRGDFVQHWGYWKKSLRIKTKKSRLFEGMREVNLIAPKFGETLNNHLAYTLAKKLGLLAPRSEMVRVRVNGDYRGVYVLVEQLEELTLRHNRKMPGDLYVGEIIGRDMYRGVSNRLLDSAAYWEKAAINNHYPEDDLSPIEAYLAFVRGVGMGTGDAAGLEHIDVDAWGRFFALEVLLQTYHYSDVHNWRLYYDPWRTRIEPVVWDPDGWHPQWRSADSTPVRLDVISSDFHKALLGIQEIQLARHRAIKEFFDSGSAELFLEEVDRTAAATAKAVMYDPSVVFNFAHISPRQAAQSVERLRRAIHSAFGQVRDGYLGHYGRVTWQTEEQRAVIRLLIEGRSPVEAIEIRAGQAQRMPQRVELSVQIDSEQVVADVTGAVSVTDGALRIDVPLLARFAIHPADQAWPKDFDIAVLAASAKFRFYPALGEVPSEVLVERTGRREVAFRGEVGEPHAYPAGTVVPPAKPLKSTQRWSGNVDVEGVQVISDDLFVEAGTTVHLAEGASIIIEGRLYAAGTIEQPIRFIPSDGATGPWGTLALRGGGADGSLLRHCHLEGGSGHKVDLAEYSALLSIHDVRAVTIEDCVFRDSEIVDDTVHAVYSEVTIRRSQFENAAFDALDLDISTAVVDGCSFRGSGNDAIDLMESEVVVLNSKLSNSGDKGISVGEGSRLWSINNLIESNVIGIESKDGSLAVVANTTLRGNGQALHAYQKNWRYDRGGVIRLLKSIVNNHKVPISIEARSWLWVYDSSVEEPLIRGKRVELAGGVGQAHRTKAIVGSRRYVPDVEAWGASKFLAPHWKQFDAARVGASILAD